MKVIVENFIMIILLLMLSAEDIKYKSISVIKLAAARVAAIIYKVVFGETDINSIFIGIIFLTFMLVISVATKCIGIGDVAVLVIIAVVKGSIFAINTFLIAILFSFVVSAVLLILRKVTRKYSMPFIPFLGVGMLGVMICA